MPPIPSTPADPGEPRIRDRGDACPGALRLHAADDGRLARLRLPAGLLTSRQLMTLADAAERLGDGAVSITSRGNVELRGLGDDCGAELAELLRGAGLLPSDTHERVRNIVASPLAGLDGLGCADVQLWARELDALLCATTRAADLSGRFLFALDDGRGDVAGLGADVTLLAEPGDTVVVRVGGAGFRVPAAAAARAALAAAEAFLAAAAGTGAWRVRDLPDGGAGLAGACGELFPTPPLPEPGASPPDPDGGGSAPAPPRLKLPLRPAAWGDPQRGWKPGLRPAFPARWGHLPGEALGEFEDTAGGRTEGWGLAPPVAGKGRVGTEPTAGPPPGIVEGPGAWAPVAAAPLGRLTAAQLRALLPAPAGEVRFTPWRGVVVPGFAEPEAAEERLRALDAAGFITGPADPWYGATACTGRPGCGKALADVRADAAPGRGGLPVHFSGCERRCGHPHGDWTDVVATADGRYEVDGVPCARSSLAATVAAARTTGTTLTTK
ncbi:cobalamin biosynthesis protein CobG [Streptomyces sp. FIT100]|uniref:cobalamin biosynthesis protein CobG n=1 Tax=Streptomyces sp. FIT100 TaxID=2837956 RepID=UPI0021C8FDD6|nr:cobalamin biosynthesis protein CobG [Streptomyces sp. FIT100]